jgi:hypothetical protein
MSNERHASWPVSALPIARSRVVTWINIALALIVAAIGLGVGFAEEWLPAQQVILYTVLTAAAAFSCC